MASIELTLGNTVLSFPLLADNPSPRVQKAIRRILEKTTNEIIKNLRVPGRDYKDHTFQLRRGFRRRRMAGYRYKVYNRTEYASFIEYGTRHIDARRMMHREVYNARARLRRRLAALQRDVERGRV